MTAATILTMANGKGIDLNAVTAADVHFPTWAEHVAKEPRFNGATPDTIYFVAQHMCIGTDAMLRAGATEEEAAYFHLHDLPEGVWKDDPTPKKCTIALRISQKCGVTAESVLGVLREIDDEHEAAVHIAAGMRWPIPEEIARLVKLYDKIMFVTEWRDLMFGQPHPAWEPYEGIRPLECKIEPWPWAQARAAWLWRANRLLPALRKNPMSTPGLSLVTDELRNDCSHPLDSNQVAL